MTKFLKTQDGDYIAFEAIHLFFIFEDKETNREFGVIAQTSNKINRPIRYNIKTKEKAQEIMKNIVDEMGSDEKIEKSSVEKKEEKKCVT